MNDLLNNNSSTTTYSKLDTNQLVPAQPTSTPQTSSSYSNSNIILPNQTIETGALMPVETSRLFVTKIDKMITVSDLRAYFGTFGDVVDVYMIPHKSIAFVQYSSIEVAEAVLRTYPHVILGTAVVVDRATPRPPKTILPPGFEMFGGGPIPASWTGDSFPVLVTGLNGAITYEQLYCYLSGFGDIVDLILNYGEAYASFTTKQSQSAILIQRGHQIPGHPELGYFHVTYSAPFDSTVYFDTPPLAETTSLNFLEESVQPTNSDQLTPSGQYRLFIQVVTDQEQYVPLTVDILRAYYSQFGTLVDAFVPKHRQGLIGFIEYSSPESYMTVLGAKQHIIQLSDGTSILCRIDTARNAMAI